MDLLNSDDDIAKKNAEFSTQNEATAQNESMMKILMDIKTNQFTKQDSKSLKKSIDAKFEAVSTELGAHSSRFADIEERMSQYETKIASAQYDRELHKQQQLKCNISIFGYPKLEKENLKETAIKIFKAFNCDFTACDFAAVYRTEGRSSKFSSIVVKFHDFNKKLMALNSKAKKPVKLNDITGGTTNNINSQIYLNNHVTPFFGRLLAAGRQATKDEVIHSCWIGATGCLIKAKEDSKPVNVRSLDDFETLRAQMNTKSNTKRNKPDDITIASNANKKTK